MYSDTIPAFAEYLEEEEKSPATIEKYTREAKRFLGFLTAAERAGKGGPVGMTCADGAKAPNIDKQQVLAYKAHLVDQGYSAAGINAMLAGLRAFLCFVGAGDIKVKNLRVQRKSFVSEERILRREDYQKLLTAAKAKGDQRLFLIMETIASTGIRVSELAYFTAEALPRGEVTIRLKGKDRTILLPEKLQKKLQAYAAERGIGQGPLFRNRRGQPINRSVIWAEMKRLAQAAGVILAKVFPHNFRKLFARTFYRARHDIAMLADVLGHSSVDTTRIYVRESQNAHRRSLDGLALIL